MQGGNGFSTSLHVNAEKRLFIRALRPFILGDGTCYANRFATVEAK